MNLSHRLLNIVARAITHKKPLDLDDLLRFASHPEHAQLLVDEFPLVRLDHIQVILVLERLGEDVHIGHLDEGTAVVVRKGHLGVHGLRAHRRGVLVQGRGGVDLEKVV